MSFTNLITSAIDSVADEILRKPNPTVCELGNQRLKNKKARNDLFKRLGINSATYTGSSTKVFFPCTWV